MINEHPLKIGKELPSLKEFSLPIDLVTQTVAVLARKGKGKSYLAAVIAEELMNNEQVPVIIDPTGAHWGIKASADGKGEGFHVVIFGGKHADLPLDEHGGEVIAQAIVKHRFPAIIDLSHMRKGEANRFMGAFLETLYRLNELPLHLICDEADTYAPQRPFGDEARTLGAMEDIVRKGRIKGIGCTMLTQRPQILNKNVLTQAEILVTLGMSHPKDIGAIKEWVDMHATIDESKEMMATLPTMPAGRAWFWAPGWGYIFTQVNVRQRMTFDSGRTPRVGETIAAPGKLATINLEALGAQLKEMAEEAIENDPEAQRKEIARLKDKIRELEAAPRRSLVEETVLRYIKDSGQCIADYAQMLLKPTDSGPLTIEKLRQAQELLKQGEPSDEPPQNLRPHDEEAAPPPPRAPKRTGAMVEKNDTLTPVARKFLNVLAHRRGKITNRDQLAILAGYSCKSRHVDNTLGSSRSRGLIVGRNDNLQISDLGLEMLGTPAAPMRGRQLVDYWLGQIDLAQSTMLRVLVDVYPKHLTRDEIAVKSGYSPTSRHVDNSLGALRGLKLAIGDSRGTKASPDLFL
jgi:hypothetical protein